MGDLLWYVANVATKFDLDLAQVAKQNLTKCEGRWGDPPGREPFDAGFPDDQRFPRQFSVDFLTYHDAEGAPRVRVMYKGKQFGDDLTDLSHTKDGYGYHDVIHLAFAAVLGCLLSFARCSKRSGEATRSAIRLRMGVEPSPRRKGCQP